MQYAAAREWSQVHGRQIEPRPLKEGIERRIKEWFELVDDDGSGALDTDELAFAMQVMGIVWLCGMHAGGIHAVARGG